MSDTLPIPKERNLFFYSDVNQDSVSDISKEIISINDVDKKIKNIFKMNGLKYKPKPIKIFIDSYGGFTYQINGLISLIENSKTPIHTIATGCAMSCGFLLLISGHKRFCYKNTTILHHEISGGTSGNLTKMEETIKEYKILEKNTINFILEKTLIPKKKLKKIKKQKLDWIPTLEEAIEYKIIDKIL